MGNLELWHAELSQNLGFAVALTSKQAIVWRYKYNTSLVGTMKPLTIELPSQGNAAHSSDNSLPLGQLVHDTGAGELALLVVMPVSGKIIYWESVVGASSIDLARQRRQGLQGVVGGLLSGETITTITEAEPDGFILTTSNGRVVHVAVRDPQGRPAVAVQFLRPGGGSSRGLFGGLKSVFNISGWRRDIAAVRAGPLLGKSHRHCFVATGQGLFQAWDLIRHSVKSLIFEIDAKEEIFRSIKLSSSRVNPSDSIDNFIVVDFVLFPNPHSPSHTQNDLRFLFLTAFVQGSATTYHLIDLSVTDGSAEVNVIHPINCFRRAFSEVSHRKAWKPRLLLPESAKTAFVGFDDCIVLRSLATIEQSPSSQLQSEAHSLPDPFQDVIYLRQGNGTDFYTVGCAVESSDQEPEKATCTFLIHGFGMARVTVLPPKDGQSASARTEVTVKSKIEQAIFFGDKPNLLDFNVDRGQISYRDEEVEAAALEINDSIMKGSSSYIPFMTPSMDDQLKLRVSALAELVKFIKKYSITYPARWKFLWSAEKMAAAKAIWRTFNTGLAVEDSNQKRLLPELLDMLHERHKEENQPERGETDIVRHYLTYDIFRIEMVIPWAYQAIKELESEGARGKTKLATYVSQANDIQIQGMEAAFTFRAENALHYGIHDTIQDGVLQENYESLPPFWTSIPLTVTKVRELAELSYQTAENNASNNEGEEIEIDLGLLRKLVLDTPRLIHICCQVYDERCRWLRSRADKQQQAEGEALGQAYLEARRDLIVKLVEIEQIDEGIRLAENYQDLQALVDVITRSTDLSLERLEVPGLSDSEEEELQARVDSNLHRVETYFEKYGAQWATVFYTKSITQNQVGSLLDNADEFRGFLTQFLRSRPEYAKLCWLNDIFAERDYVKAADALYKASKRETNLWSKKVNLSLGKLAVLAAREREQSHKSNGSKMLKRSDRNIAAMDIQERLQSYMHPALRGAIDETAEVELAMKAFAHHYTQKKPKLRQTLERNLKQLVARQALDIEDLLETLTLMDDDPQLLYDEGFFQQRFLLALQLVKQTFPNDANPAREELHEKIIWRRCLIQDDWETLNRTEEKDDATVSAQFETTALFQTVKAGFEDGQSFSLSLSLRTQRPSFCPPHLPPLPLY